MQRQQPETEAMRVAWRDWYCRCGIVSGLPFGAGLYATEGWLGVGIGTSLALVLTVGAFIRAAWRDAKARMVAQ